MKNFAKIGMMAFAFFVATLIAGAPRAAAQDSSIAGTVLDFDGKPWPDLGMHLESDQGTKTDGKTDKSGKYTFSNLRAGNYKISVDLPMQKEPYLAAQVKVGSGQTVPADLNLKTLVADKNPEYVAALKKQGDAASKFQGMKQHFEAGTAAMLQVSESKAALAKASAEQRDEIKKQIADNSAKAVSEFEQSKAAATEKDPNLHLILARLGDAYEASGRSDDAINAYKQAIELKPTAPYYDNLGSVYGRAGKIDDAKAAYAKAAELDPPNAAHAWLNFGITMYNAQKYQDAVEPLKKATQLAPTNAQAWYLLATCMVADPSIYKQKGDKMEVTPLPGTSEAYEQAIKLDPNGPWGAQAKQGLDQLNTMTGGIDTKINAKKKKP